MSAPGSEETPPDGPAQERPFVTFALFAYNQEQFIREAVEGAFSQTYEPLEIILSDDCSSDRTFAIMQEMAAGYVGPHRVIVRRNAFNLGTAQHVQSAFAASKGVLFMVAAGDDISLSNRAGALVTAWDKAGRPSGVVHSGREVFRDTGNVVLRRVPPKPHAQDGYVLKGYAHAEWLPAAAPTCAYTRDVFEKFAPLVGGSIIEDAPLFIRAALIGRFVACDKVLVRQRLHDENNGSGYQISEPARWNRFIQSKMVAFRNMQTDLNHWQGDIPPGLRIQIEKRLLAVSNSAAGLFLPETRPLCLVTKMRFALKMTGAPVVAKNFRLRVEYALSFFGFDFHTRLKSLLRRKLSGG